MANSNEAQPQSSSQTTETKSRQDKVAVKGANTAKKSVAGCAFNPILILIIAAVAFLVSLYALYSNKHSEQLSNQQSQAADAAIAQLKQQQTEVESGFNTVKETLSQAQTALHNQMQALDKNLQTAMQQRLYQKQDWLLLKARYYLELAQINAHWSDDTQATIALLEQADALLLNQSNQHLFTVRQAIAKEISQLQSLPKSDIPGLLSQLDAAQTAISNLPIKQPLSATTNRPAEDNSSSSPWKEKLKSSVSVLEKLVVIRHNDENIRPLLSPLHQTLLRDSLRLNLQETQWAILQNNPQVYQLSLNRALQDIQVAFDTNSAATQALIKQLQTLQQEKFEKQQVTLEESLSLLNQYIESKNSQIMDKAAAPEGGKTP
ncbi:Putative uroporphyrinogen-III C-methyltransferase [Legionella massiliensis]|uniref:Putative uroporphyrinogen-III C-methyltransferase n=1 Tax=Legionella massiliensis TaxID=1034943 RepID=A0A078L1Q1_9GAMM|nr:uroporphyrinogen-III C-methyltransferase [Legionella massiliensis]CDZ77929.1 Putative uroporphyrinogen-III C-methyltransferase [Legionella massiliensis]CEE13667.1 Putative uroporphyrinogen-III C-methyltransferase [Legionella massiliensis]